MQKTVQQRSIAHRRARSVAISHSRQPLSLRPISITPQTSSTIPRVLLSPTSPTSSMSLQQQNILQLQRIVFPLSALVTSQQVGKRGQSIQFTDEIQTLTPQNVLEISSRSSLCVNVDIEETRYTSSYTGIGLLHFQNSQTPTKRQQRPQEPVPSSSIYVRVYGSKRRQALHNSTFKTSSRRRASLVIEQVIKTRRKRNGETVKENSPCAETNVKDSDDEMELAPWHRSATLTFQSTKSSQEQRFRVQALIRVTHDVDSRNQLDQWLKPSPLNNNSGGGLEACREVSLGWWDITSQDGNTTFLHLSVEKEKVGL